MISIIISSATESLEELLFPGIEKVVAYTDMDYELIVISPYKIAQTFPNTRFVYEEDPSGSCASANLGFSQAIGDYLVCLTDDNYVRPEWCKVIREMQKEKKPVSALQIGTTCGIRIPHLPIIEREFFYGDIMKGFLFDPAFFTSYIDVDLGFRLCKIGITLMEYEGQVVNIYDPFEDNKGLKKSIKKKWLRCDGMIWHSKNRNNQWVIDSAPLYAESPYSDPELIEIAVQRIMASPFWNKEEIRF